MKNNRSLLTLLSIALVCLFSSIAVFTGAWFTYTKSAGTATITVGNAVTITTTGTLQDKTVMPGSNVQFASVAAKAEANTSDMYVRAYVSIQGSAGNQLTITSAGTNWKEYDGYFYYTASTTDFDSSSTMSQLKSLSAGASTEDLTLTAVVSEDATEETLIPGTTITCTVYFQAIQVENLGTKTIYNMRNEWGELPKPVVYNVVSNDETLGTVEYETNNNIVTLKAKPAANSLLLGWRNEDTKKIIPNFTTYEEIMPLSLLQSNELNLTSLQISMYTPFKQIALTSEELETFNQAREVLQYYFTIWNFDENILNEIANQEIQTTDVFEGSCEYTALFVSVADLMNEESGVVTTETLNGITYMLIEDCGIALVAQSQQSEVNIAETINNCSVIGALVNPSSTSSVFTSATSITIPNSFTTLQAGLLMGSTLLTTVSFPNDIKFIDGAVFKDCSSLQNINIPRGITIGGGLFYGCTSLTSIDLTDCQFTGIAEKMFYDCSNLETIILTNTNTSAVKTFFDTFSGCIKLTSLDLTSWDTSKVCKYLSAFDGEGMQHMFEGCSSLVGSFSKDSNAAIRISDKFTTSAVVGMGGMFKGCSGLTKIDLSQFDFQNIVGSLGDIYRGFESMFEGCTGLIGTVGSSATDVIQFPTDMNTSKLLYMKGIFKGCTGLTSIDLSMLNTHSVTDCRELFTGCTNLQSVNLSGWNLSSCGYDHLSSWFKDCPNLQSINIGDWASTNSAVNFLDEVTCKIIVSTQATYDWVVAQNYSGEIELIS